MTLTFTSSGAQLDGMSVQAIPFVDEETANELRAPLQYISQSLMGRSKTKTRRWTLELLMTSKWDTERNNSAREEVVEFETAAVKPHSLGPFVNYKHGSGKPQLQSNCMLNHARVGQIMLGYGIEVNRLYEGMVYTAFTNMEHRGELFWVENSRVLVIAVKLQQTKILDNSMTLRVKEGQEFEVYINDEQAPSDRPNKVNSIVNNGKQGFKGDFNFLISVIDNKTLDIRERFGPLISPNRIRSAPVDYRHDIKLIAILNDGDYKRSIRSIHVIDEPEQYPAVDKWQSSFLLQYADRLPKQRLSTDTYADKWKNSVIKAGYKGQSFNKQ